MRRELVPINVEVDRKTDAILREWAEASDRSKRSLARVILNRRAARWQKKRRDDDFRQAPSMEQT